MQPSDFPSHSPYSSSGGPVLEFTVRAVVLGIVLSAIMTAANVYLGLKAGMTVSASIPAAVISMGILRGILKKGTILENNLVQTIASAGESLAAGIIFTIPGLVLTGVWLGFDYWTTSLVALLGGVLGIMFMIPLRRTLIVEEVELKYPEGLACAKVLEAGQKGGGDIRNILVALGIGAVIAWFIKGVALFKGTLVFAHSIGKSAIGLGLDVSTALIGVGYIVGFNIALLVFIGGAIAWFVAIPIAFPSVFPQGLPLGEDGKTIGMMDAVFKVWSTQIRYMGIGAMVIGGLWSIFKMRRGVLKGINDAFGGYAQKKEQEGRVPRTETDMPMRSIVVVAVAMIIGIFFLYTRVTQNLTVTAKGGISVVRAKNEGEFPAYGQVPLASTEEWKAEGTTYEKVNHAYLLEVGSMEQDFVFSLPPKPGDKVEPAGIPEIGRQITVTTVGNQIFSGTVTEVKKKSFTILMQMPKIVQLPAGRISQKVDAKPGEEISLSVGSYNYHGKFLAEVQEGTHLLTNDGQRFILTSSEIVGWKTNYRLGMSFIALIAMLVTGFLFVAVASYIAGLVGSSNNPVSGMIICTILFTAGLFLLFGFTGNIGIIATLGVAGVVCCAAATAGDVSQDLKTGWLVKATPAKQQYGQLIGVVASAFLIAPVMSMLHNAYTIGSKEFPGPQAVLFSSIVQKVFHHEAFPLLMSFIGAGVAIVLIVIDEILRKKKSAFRMHVMPVAVGIYLPITVAVPILIGGLANLITGRIAGKTDETRKAAVHRGTLFCAGLISGEAILGVIIGVLMLKFALPFKVWKKGVEFWPEMISIGVVVLIVALIFIVSLTGKKESKIS